ncbi:MAG TPA: hypothetical protein VHY18_08920 [Solirubrobacteraceae bacterium]|nr:hypothetical protein [Solirubrobacteraceae bacterium]
MASTTRLTTSRVEVMMEVRELIGGLSGVSCLVAVIVLAGLFVRPEHNDVRLFAYWGSGVSAPVAVASLAVSSVTWSRACAVLTLLICAQAASLAFALHNPLSEYVDDVEPLGDPSWWPAFEHQFRVYERQAR